MSENLLNQEPSSALSNTRKVVGSKLGGRLVDNINSALDDGVRNNNFNQENEKILVPDKKLQINLLSWRPVLQSEYRTSS